MALIKVIMDLLSFCYSTQSMPFENQIAQWSATYGPVCNWPSPYHYTQWFASLPQQYQIYYIHPSNYNQLYQTANLQAKPNKSKLTRNQKRKQKMQNLKSQLELEKQSIGNWVHLERKDLIESIKKIQQKDQENKQKKKNKLSHLIQIHKKVAQFYKKKNNPETQDHKNRRVNIKKKKDRVSFIKKMKVIFDQKTLNVKTIKEIPQHVISLKKQQNNICETKVQSKEQNKGAQEQIYETQSEEEVQIIEKAEQQKKYEAKGLVLKEIEYDKIGKLTGKEYNNFFLREWVTNMPNEQLEDICLRVINKIAFKQAIKRVEKPQKARKMIVSGIKECRRTLRTINQKKRSKILIVGLNVERNNLEKGVDDEVQINIKMGEALKIPIMHVSTRSKLGRAFTGKFGPRVTMISIVYYEGYQDMVQEMIEKWQQTRDQYNSL